MNWLVLISNITFTAIAALLCVLSLKTLKAIRHLNTGKSFWIPAFASGLLFSIGSIITILIEVGLSLTSTYEIGQIIQLVALCFLLGGIYGYHKMIRKNLSEKYILAEAISTQNGKKEAHVAPYRSVDEKPITPNNLSIKPAQECNHQLGYLRTLPTNASLPEECLICDRIIKCKHS